MRKNTGNSPIHIFVDVAQFFGGMGVAVLLAVGVQTVVLYVVAILSVGALSWLGTGFDRALVGDVAGAPSGTQSVSRDVRVSSAGQAGTARIIAKEALNSYRFVKRGGAFVPGEEARLALDAVALGTASEGQRAAELAAAALKDPHLRRWLEHSGMDRIHFRLSDEYRQGVYREWDTGDWFARRVQDDGAFEYHLPRAMFGEPRTLAKYVANDLVAETGGARIRVEGRTTKADYDDLVKVGLGTTAGTAAAAVVGVNVAEQISPLYTSGLMETGIVLPAVIASGVVGGSVVADLYGRLRSVRHRAIVGKVLDYTNGLEHKLFPGDDVNVSNVRGRSLEKATATLDVNGVKTNVQVIDIPKILERRHR